MQKHGLGRRRAQEPAPEREIESELAYARRQVRLRKVVPAWVAKRFADEEDQSTTACRRSGVSSAAA